MAAGYSRRLSVFGAASVLVLSLVGMAPGASAGGRSAVTGPAVTGSTFPGRSTIPHLSQRLAALAANPVDSIRAQARITSTPESGPGSLLRQHGTDRLLVDIRVARWDSAVIARLQDAGARIVHRDAALRTVTGAVVPSALLALSRVSGVQYMTDIAAPQLSAVCDSTISEGDQILHAVQERTNAAVDGTGVTVGILSDSFDTWSSAPTHAADDVTSDNLPGSTNTCGHTTPVGVLDDYSGGGQEDEGRAMAQIVHDLAPGAKILFATAEGGPDMFAANIRQLANAGANIIVDDVSYFDEPFYQDGVIAKAVNDVRAAGVDYFSSAANNNIIVGGHDVASYEAVDGYRATTCPLAISTDLNLDYTDCHNFNDAGGAADPTYGFTVAANRQVNMVLDWAEPQFGVKTDYGLCVMSGTTLLGCADDRNPGANGTQLADEVAFASSGSSTVNFSVVVTRYGGNIPNTNATPRFKLTFLTNGSGAVTNVDYATPTGTDVIGPTIFGHNGTSGAVSTAASDVRVVPSTVTDYSSRGPVTLLYGPVVGTTPAAPLATPQVLAKPDITASHCGINTFFGGGDRFCGTSAAAPHAAAVAALLLQQDPDLTPDQLNAVLASTAVDLGLPAAVQGSGLIDASAAGADGAVVPRTQTITFAQPARGAVGGSRTLSATASSGLPVAYTVGAATNPAGACTVSGAHGATVHYLKTGSCVVDASQPGNALYLPAQQVTRTIVVSAAPSVATKSLPSGALGKKYAASLAAQGGNSPFTWGVTTGRLPTGLSLAKSGAISGKPSKAGTFHVTVAATDSSAPTVSASRQFTITIAPIAVRTSKLPSGVVGKKYAAKLAAYGGKSQLAWTLTSGKLPTGLSLARSGAVAGKPSKAGTYHFTVRATDSAHKKASKALTIVVKPK
jgi:hypothetical protein